MVTAFGKFLRKLRVDRELTLRDMATSLGISSAYLSAMELGKRTIQPQLVDKIAAIYGVSCDQEIQQLICVPRSPINWNDMSDLGLIVRINKEILHPLGLAISRNPMTGFSEKILVADDGIFEYAVGIDSRVMSDDAIRLKLSKKI